jgi:xanthine dehydrogenase accessory factor
MRGQNLSVLDALVAQLKAGQTIYLATVIETWGASPRPAGSLLAYAPVMDTVYGSLSGGCVEDALLRDLHSNSLTTPLPASDACWPQLRRFGEDADGLDLPCGAVLELLIEKLTPSTENIAHFERLLCTLVNRSSLLREVSLSNGAMRLIPVSANSWGDSVIKRNTKLMTHKYELQSRLLVVGAGDVSRYLIPLAQSADFAVTLCEPRKDVLSRQANNYDCQIMTDCLPDDLVLNEFANESCAVVAVAHDPRVDDLALLAALQKNCFYVGAMGSERNSAKRRRRLADLGLSNEHLSRLFAPIGIEISSRTPAEIAISIVAQLITERAKAVGRFALNQTFEDQQFFND